MAKPTSQELIAAVLTEIHLGIAMARAAGVVCGSPQNIKITRIRDK
jgi:hypothetical protein